MTLKPVSLFSLGTIKDYKYQATASQFEVHRQIYRYKLTTQNKTELHCIYYL